MHANCAYILHNAMYVRRFWCVDCVIVIVLPVEKPSTKASVHIVIIDGIVHAYAYPLKLRLHPVDLLFFFDSLSRK